MLQPKLEFNLDTEEVRLKYNVRDPRPENTIHIGQRKLFLSELRFLTEKVDDTVGRTIVVYVGAASGQHMSLIRELFPTVTFLLFDGAPFRIQGPVVRAQFHRLDEYIMNPRPGLYLFNELFFDHHARVLETAFRKYLNDEDSVLFISDIRTTDADSDDTDDHNVLMDLVMQYRWVQILRVDWCLLKFRYTFHSYPVQHLIRNLQDIILVEESDIDFLKDYSERTLTYFDGELWPQAFSGRKSSEVRLMTSGRDVKNYGPASRYSEILFGYNMLIRPLEHVNEFADATLGFDHCGDCSIEAWTWRRYFEKIGVSEEDMRGTVHEHVRRLSQITRSLLQDDHGYLGLSESGRRPTEVQQFYDRDRSQTRQQREESPVYDLRALNNFVKAALINRYTPRGAVVIDLGGGRGGDLSKYSFAGASRVVITDISPNSLDVAENRYSQMASRNPRMFQLDLVEADSSDPGLIEDLPQADIVSAQFHLHYVFDTEERAAQTLKTISDALKPGGHLLLTIPNAEYIQSRLVDGRMGNDLFSIRLTDVPNEYTFSLADSIDNVNEYFIPREQIMRLAEENCLNLVFEMPFNEFIQKDLSNAERNLMPRMVRNAFKESRFIPIPRTQWEIFRIYKIMVFEKCSDDIGDSVLKNLLNHSSGRRQLEQFIRTRSQVRSNRDLFDSIIKIIQESNDDVSAYRDLRELIEEVVDPSMRGTFDLETWKTRANARARRIANALPRGFQPTRILDLGSSDASITSALGELFNLPPEDVYAMDIREDPNLGIAGDNFTFRLIEPGQPLPFEDSSISLVTTNMVLHHIENPENTVQEIYRILQPGGYYSITEHDWTGEEDLTWFLDVVHGLYATVLSDPAEMTPEEFVNEHFAEYRSIGDWRRMIEDAGFELVRDNPPRFSNDLMRSHSMLFRKPTTNE